MARLKENQLPLLLIGLVILNLTYPFSEQGVTQAIVFNVFYTVVLISAVSMVSTSPRRRIINGSVAAVNLILGTLSFIWPQYGLVWFMTVAVMQAIISYELAVFIFTAKDVTRNVLFAGVAVYLMLGMTFVPVYNVLNTLMPGAIVMSTGGEVTWQRLLYFSFATLTTLGYGDVLPVAPQVQALAAMEAVLGVLYVAILMARLVGLYQERRGVL
ncbi:MAG: two pore domain potassium channel family protein [Chloroflexi bacterium]|nr:two pore domain potassium channel family protein [Chloroflexota bacterium]